MPRRHNRSSDGSAAGAFCDNRHNARSQPNRYMELDASPRQDAPMSDSDQAPNVVRVRRFAGRLDDKAVQLVQKIEGVARGALDVLVGSMMDKADDTLFDLAGKSDSSSTQQLYFDAMRDLRVKRQSIERGFRSEIKKAFEDFVAGRPVGLERQERGASSDELSLALVDEEEMEESIAIKNMAAKAERACYQVLYELTERLKAATRRGDLDETRHPLSPGTIARAFGDTLSPLETDIQVKLIIHKLFDKHVMSGMVGLHKEVNALLVNEGILPKIRRSVRRPPGVGPPGRPASGAPGGGAHHTPSGPSGAEASGGAGSGPYGQGVFGPGGVAAFVGEATTLVGALSAMQGYVVNHDMVDQLSPDEFEAHVLDLSNQVRAVTSGRGAAVADEKTINMVSVIFDYILDDEDLPLQVKVLIARLQIPVLKVALIDGDFFGRKQHPVRALVNEMAHAGLSWNGDTTDGTDPLLETMAGIVDRILNEFDDDPSLFEELLAELRSFLEQESERARVFEERTRKTAEGRERVAYARRRTDAWIDMWTARDELPEFIRAFLRNTWRNALLVTMHRYGENSREWAARVQTVNNLLWSVTPKKTEKGTRLLLEMIPEILNEIREGMELASAHPHTIDAFFRELAQCHAQTVGGRGEGEPDGEGEPRAARGTPDTDGASGEIPRHGAIEEAPPGLEEVIKEIVLTFEAGQRELAINEPRDEHTRQVESLSCGDWVEFQTDNGKPLRAKLCWRSPVTSCYLFVDHKGTKVAEKSLAELVQDLRAGRGRILDGVPLLDRAINALWDRGAFRSRDRGPQPA